MSIGNYPESMKYLTCEPHVKIVQNVLRELHTNHGVVLCQHLRNTPSGDPIYDAIDAREQDRIVLAFFGIDRDRCESERQMMAALIGVLRV